MEQKENSGALFRNENKVEGSNQPDYTGNVIINGERKRLAAWIKESQAGKKFMSIKISDFNDQGTENKAGKAESKADDDLPF
jgi:uncharacterized protein (DUF736 family)